VRLEYDGTKRAETLLHREVDFARASDVFACVTFTREDERNDYGEVRMVTVGLLDERNGRDHLDATRRGASHHQHEKSQ